MNRLSPFLHRAAWLLPALIALACAIQVTYRRLATRQANVTLRFAHWGLQSGLREGYEALAREFEALHPGVRVEQIPVPVRTWYSWQQTQLVGNDPPDIMQLSRIAQDEPIARYFVPLGQFAAEPNPFNAGTPLAGQPWRDSFFDGLNSVYVYYPALHDVYGVPTMLMNLRLFYNRTLLESVAGTIRPPETYREYLGLCRQIAAYREKTGRTLLPLAGSADYGTYLMHQAMQRLTQRLRARIDPARTLIPGATQVGLACLQGMWDLDSAEVRGGLQVFAALGRGMQPGFLQLRREDAALYFTQGKSVMMLSGSWDYHLLRQECPFPLVIGPIPLPTSSDPEFGRFAVGPAHEGEQMLSGIFGITRASRHQELALDFLRFITSVHASRQFAAMTSTLPATRGIEVADPAMLAFAPVEDGPVNGFGLAVGPETAHWFATRVHELFRPGESPETFAARNRAAYRQAVAADLRQIQTDANRTNLAADSVLVASLLAPVSGTERERAAALFAGQIAREVEACQIETVLAH